MIDLNMRKEFLNQPSSYEKYVFKCLVFRRICYMCLNKKIISRKDGTKGRQRNMELKQEE